MSNIQFWRVLINAAQFSIYSVIQSIQCADGGQAFMWIIQFNLQEDLMRDIVGISLGTCCVQNLVPGSVTVMSRTIAGDLLWSEEHS